MIKTEKLYSLEDISIIPAVSSDIRSRKECCPFTESIEGAENYYPIIAAPMDSVVDEFCYQEFWESRLSCVLPRTVPLVTRLIMCERVFCAFGFKEIEEELLGKTFDHHENLYVLIDVANGHMDYQLELGQRLREKYGSKLKLMGGNIANPETIKLYDRADFDYVRCGVGGGRGCLTAVQTSIHYPMASLLEDTVSARDWINGKVKIIADGGIRTYSDAIKCLALGADYVMMGYTLSKSLEASGDLYDSGGKKISRETAKDHFKKGNQVYKEYHGMSTKVAQAKILGVSLEENRRQLKTSEGRSEMAKVEYTLSGWTENLGSYLRSTMSYTGSRTLGELKKNAVCQIISDSTREKLNR